VSDDSDDPWKIGNQFKQFELEVTVSDQASDLHYVNVEFAAFETGNVRLRLAGEWINYAGNGVIDFSDNSLVGYDLIVFSGDFEHLGRTVEIGSGFTLPESTFDFAQLVEVPPLFQESTVVDRSSCCGGPYTTIVAAETLVSGVPESSSIVLLIGLGVAAAWMQRLRRCTHPTLHLPSPWPWQ
jgi:hypothetical protein